MSTEHTPPPEGASDQELKIFELFERVEALELQVTAIVTQLRRHERYMLDLKRDQQLGNKGIEELKAGVRELLSRLPPTPSAVL